MNFHMLKGAGSTHHNGGKIFEHISNRHYATYGWFEDQVTKMIGDEGQTYFWSHKWSDELTFKDSYSRLYQVTTNKEVLIVDLLNHHVEPANWAWNWRRPLFVWEEEAPSKVLIFSWRMLQQSYPLVEISLMACNKLEYLILEK